MFLHGQNGYFLGFCEEVLYSCQFENLINEAIYDDYIYDENIFVTHCHDVLKLLKYLGIEYQTQ